MKPMFEKWAKAQYPQHWAKLVSKGGKGTLTGPKFDVERIWRA